MGRRKHNYVVGYKGEGQCAYGRDTDGNPKWIDLMTLDTARRSLKKSARCQMVVYKLVEVKG